MEVGFQNMDDYSLLSHYNVTTVRIILIDLGICSDQGSSLQSDCSNLTV